ncbi:TetR/AcrR family transcriptional regulator [Diaminobutyricimonas aerilata]|nr:TetR/AcrR family transcriptional regulator [Diaminobutyricimonas aerilata]
MTTADAEVRAPGRPRDRRVEEGILRATQDLLITEGYAGMTVADVARTAGSGKSAIYRRWPSKVQLVVAAVRALQSEQPLPNTGSLRDDLLACAMHYARADERASRVLASLLSELGRDRELYEAAHAVIGGPPVAALVAVIERWQERGVIAASRPVGLIAGIVPSVAFGSVSLRQRGLDPDTVTQLVDSVLLPALLAD